MVSSTELRGSADHSSSPDPHVWFGLPSPRRWPRYPVEAAYREAGIDHEGGDSLEEFSAKLAAQPLCFSPGQGWRYGLSHDLLGRVIEVVTREPVAEVFEERLFSRLNMASTGFIATAEMTQRLGACWRHRPGETPELELLDHPSDCPRMASCGGGLLSTTDDYVNFLLMLRDGGTFEGERLRSSASVDEIVRDQLPAKIALDGFDDFAGFGFGGQVERDGSDRFSWGGYAGTAFEVDRANNRVTALHIQVLNDYSIGLWDELAMSHP